MIRNLREIKTKKIDDTNAAQRCYETKSISFGINPERITFTNTHQPTLNLLLRRLNQPVFFSILIGNIVVLIVFCECCCRN